MGWRLEGRGIERGRMRCKGCRDERMKEVRDEETRVVG